MIIGDVDTRFDHLKRGDWDLYMAFYNGWLEGRTELITEWKDISGQIRSSLKQSEEK